jgi:hypothetical protein
MAEVPIDQYVLAWSGFPGAPGYSIFYAVPGGGFASVLHQFFVDIKTNFPSSVKITFPASGRTIDATTGDQVNVWTEAAQSVVQGTSASTYSAPTGAVVNWKTSTVWRGKLIRGRTFLVPLIHECFDTDGSLASGSLGAIQTAAGNLVSNAGDKFVIWSQPQPTNSDPDDRDGFRGKVTSAVVPDKAVVLRSRRP